jgi:hypothetical protein
MLADISVPQLALIALAAVLTSIIGGLPATERVP